MNIHDNHTGIDPDPVTHTPGPWNVGTGWIYEGEVAKGAREICRFDYPTYTDTKSLWDETDANARLMSAAPDLLEALVLLEEWAHLWTDEDHHHLVLARKAIAKATGE